MITVSATEFSKHFGRYREVVQREPVAVRSHERVTGYFVSTAEYEEYMRLKSMLPNAYGVEELSEETIQALTKTTMDKRHKGLNRLMDE